MEVEEDDTRDRQVDKEKNNMKKIEGVDVAGTRTQNTTKISLTRRYLYEFGSHLAQFRQY